jgi:hypothetical protein
VAVRRLVLKADVDRQTELLAGIETDVAVEDIQVVQ